MKKNLLFTTILLSFFISENIFSQEVTPAESDGLLYFEAGDIYFEVDPDAGAKISSLQFNGEEIMFVNQSGINWGSTFWPSPQTWAWPPSTILDSEPYSGGINGNSIVLTSEADNSNSYHLKFKKIFQASLSDTSITITYTMINTGTAGKEFSPWEITRVTPPGLIFFPYGEGEFSGYGELPQVAERIDETAWYYFTGQEDAHQKLLSDGKYGWLAFVNENNILFVKKFEDIPLENQAPNENEIEVYLGAGYTELENQGEFAEIPAGDSVEYTVKWFIRALPENITVEKGSSGLLDYVRSITGSGPDHVSGIQVQEKELFKVYFNTQTNQLIIKSEENHDSVSVEIFDIQGKNILSQRISGNLAAIETGSFSNGVYFYKVLSEPVKSGKFMINR